MPMRGAMFMGSTHNFNTNPPGHKPRRDIRRRGSASILACLAWPWDAKEAGTDAARPRRGCFYLDRSCEAQIDTPYSHKVAMKKLTIPATSLLLSILVGAQTAPRLGPGRKYTSIERSNIE